MNAPAKKDSTTVHCPSPSATHSLCFRKRPTVCYCLRPCLSIRKLLPPLHSSLCRALLRRVPHQRRHSLLDGAGACCSSSQRRHLCSALEEARRRLPQEGVHHALALHLQKCAKKVWLSCYGSCLAALATSRVIRPSSRSDEGPIISLLFEQAGEGIWLASACLKSSMQSTYLHSACGRKRPSDTWHRCCIHQVTDRRGPGW